MAQWFCVAATMMFNSMAFAVDTVSHTGFDTTSWLPAMGWALSGGDFSMVLHGDRFVIAETEKVKRFDELRVVVSD
jgi:roadblock/LC7 domain-containing protein